MADNTKIFPPGYRVIDTNGDPVASATITFYDAGTSNLRTVYSDNGLSTSLGSTVTCNSAGEPSSDGSAVVSVYTGTTDYKLIVKNSGGTTLGTYDNQTGALDTSTFSSDQAIPIRSVLSKAADYPILTTDQGKVIDADPSGGTVTLTLPDATTAADDWLITCKHTGTANTVIITGTGGDTIDGQTSIVLARQYDTATVVSDGANWHVLNDYKPTQTVLPQGRLTVASGTPVIVADDTANTAVYYTPYNGDVVPIYDGTRFVPREFAELTLTLSATDNLANTAYDVFVYLVSGAVTIGTGPAWTNSAAGAGDRTASALTRTKGILTNNAQITCRNNDVDATVAANQGTYVGSILIDATNAQVSCEVTFGQTRRWAVWNAYNRVPIRLIGGDSTATWNYGTAAWQPSNNDSTNMVKPFVGLAETPVTITYTQKVTGVDNTSAQAGIGWNSTSAATGQVGFHAQNDATQDGGGTMTATYYPVPFIGLNNATALEYGGAGGATMAWKGTNANTQLLAEYMG